MQAAGRAVIRRNPARWRRSRRLVQDERRRSGEEGFWRPLERLRITRAEDGQIVIDKAVKYLFEKGEWNKPGAFLKV